MAFRKMRVQLFCTVFITIIGACATKPSETREDTGLGRPKDLLESIISESDSLVYDLTYSGILPCKDCGGIKTTLQLSTKSNKFKLKEEFIKTEITPSVLMGNFNTERGFEKDEDATLYVLNDELPETEHLYFVRETGKNNILLKLDNNRQRSTHANFELKKSTD